VRVRCITLQSPLTPSNDGRYSSPAFQGIRTVGTRVRQMFPTPAGTLSIGGVHGLGELSLATMKSWPGPFRTRGLCRKMFQVSAFRPRRS